MPIVQPTEQELSNHNDWVDRLNEKVEGQCVWSRIGSELEDVADSLSDDIGPN